MSWWELGTTTNIIIAVMESKNQTNEFLMFIGYAC